MRRNEMNQRKKGVDVVSTDSGPRTKKTDRPYGLQVHGVFKCWINEREVYSKKQGKDISWLEYTTSIGRKEEDGTYKNLYIPIFFDRDIEPPEESCDIAVFTANLFVTGNKGYERISLFVRDYEIEPF